MFVFPDSPRLFTNVCMLARTLETLGLRHCFIRDTHCLIRPRYGKSRTRLANTASAGAFRHIEFERVADTSAFLQARAGRLVAAVAHAPAIPLPEFSFRSTDTVVFGSEGDGVGADLMVHVDERITIPRHGLTHSLNLGVAAGIVLYEALCQLGTLQDFSTTEEPPGDTRRLQRITQSAGSRAHKEA